MHQLSYRLKVLEESELTHADQNSKIVEEIIKPSNAFFSVATDQYRRMLIVDEAETVIDSNKMAEMSPYAEEINVEVISKDQYSEEKFNSFMKGDGSYTEVMNLV